MFKYNYIKSLQAQTEKALQQLAHQRLQNSKIPKRTITDIMGNKANVTKGMFRDSRMLQTLFART
jgi:hypothetical protein